MVSERVRVSCQYPFPYVHLASTMTSEKQIIYRMNIENEKCKLLYTQADSSYQPIISLYVMKSVNPRISASQTPRAMF